MEDFRKYWIIVGHDSPEGHWCPNKKPLCLAEGRETAISIGEMWVAAQPPRDDCWDPTYVLERIPALP